MRTSYLVGEQSDCLLGGTPTDWLGSASDDFDEFVAGSTARVCLMDAYHYQAYLDGDEYEYHGDFYNVSPIVLEVPYDDHWYLVVDSNDQRIKVEFNQIFD